MLILPGIWTLCINLNQVEIDQLRGKGFPKSVGHCFNYLAGNLENSRNDELKVADWQHSESQTSLQPHLSRYNNRVLTYSFDTSQIQQFFSMLNILFILS